MNNFTLNRTPQTTTGALAFAVGAAIASGQATWPVREIPHYAISETRPTYSDFSELLASTGVGAEYSQFSSEMASIYASLSERQQRLAEDFEAAIFDDLDSLYES